MRTLVPTLVAATLAGCAVSTTPNYDARFGDAVRQARAAQTIHPGPGSTDAIAGLDGPAAREAAARYEESFRKPPPAVNVINIGGNIANQGGGSGR